MSPRDRDVIVHGERVSGGISAHPAFRNVTASYARLYDMQHDPALRDVLTYESPRSGRHRAWRTGFRRDLGTPGVPQRHRQLRPALRHAARPRAARRADV